MSRALEILDKRWRAACEVVFKQEIGPLEDYAKWLEGLVIPNVIRKSSISGKEVAYAIPEYSEGSRWISFDEIDYGAKYSPLDLNQIKDLDSLIGAVSERACYAGNIILGNSGEVEKSSNITDSYFMLNTAMFGDCKNLAYCSRGRLCTDCFGAYGPGESEFCIRCPQTYRDRRCFEMWVTQNCSDGYYSYNLRNCSECMFCFNVQNKRFAIGNLELGRDKYAGLKEKLLSEMVGELKRKKKLPSLMDIVAKSSFEKPSISVPGPAPDGGEGRKAAEAGFQKTSALLFGAKLQGIDSYSPWLVRNGEAMAEAKSAASGKRILFFKSALSPVLLPLPERAVTEREALELGKTACMKPEQAERLTLSNARLYIGPLAFFNMEFEEGTNTHLSECSTAIESSLSYRSGAMVYSKYCGYIFYPRSCEHMFGGNQLFDCSFCIKCYHSVKLTRCFECDSCRTCSDSYFCHNCEGLQDCMFCFNVKNKRYAIGNAEVGREKYMKAKEMLLKAISGSLEKTHDFKLSIYNAGIASGKKPASPGKAQKASKPAESR
ncbi:MAG: hypothetical protein WC506_02270 [Candidatus Micrarchaeia archaeon]